MMALLKGDRTLFDVGCVTYRDDTGATHHTNFCLYFPTIKGINAGPDTGVSGTLMYWPVGNEAD